MLSRAVIGIALGVSVTGAAAEQAALSPEAHADRWPAIDVRPKLDPKIEARIDAILRRMSIEDKVGQIIQADIATVTPEDLLTYKLGSVLNGGNSAPNKDELAPPSEWLALADRFYDTSMARKDGRPRIPMIWGTDAVHGNNNIIGATLFPHNIGLGAARNPALMEAIGSITAEETAAAGLDWTFAPTLAVTQDDRWGRTYESYSEDPAVVASYARQVVAGLQGREGSKEFMSARRVIATAKHFVGDGGTMDGKDQGDARTSEAELRDIHAAGYRPALEAGALTVMASFSSWNGTKMHGNKSLLTGVLKERWGFPGLVVGDWNAHGQIPGCSNESCPAAINAGLDMFMISGDWKKLYANTLAQARSGEIPIARLDDAVRRILRVKMWAGTFEAGRPSKRPLAGQFERIGSAAGKAVARQAVRESLVLLKNEANLLPLKASAHILIAGRAADSIAQQSGGWSITWQGTNVTNAAFPNATSVRRGIEDAVAAAGGTAVYAADGSFARKPDAAIVVFGETPYAEFMGDRPDLDYSPADKSDLALLRKLKVEGIPVVAVFLSGRPLWVNAELNASDAFVAAFLPGGEGGGVADMLFRTKPEYEFSGKLSFSWPKRADQYRLNAGDKDYDPLFPFGYGLTYASRVSLPPLDEARAPGASAGSDHLFFAQGKVPASWHFLLMEDGRDAKQVVGNSGSSIGNALTIAGVDRHAQEDSRRLTWTGTAGAELQIRASRAIDLTRETNGELNLVVQYRVDAVPAAWVAIGMGDANGRIAKIPVTDIVRSSPLGQWREIAIPLQCIAVSGLDMGKIDRPFFMKSQRDFAISISDVRIARGDGAKLDCKDLD